MQGKYLIKDVEKGLEFLQKNCQALYVRAEIDDLGRLYLKGSDLAGNAVSIVIYDEATQKMPDVTKTERL